MLPSSSHKNTAKYFRIENEKHDGCKYININEIRILEYKCRNDNSEYIYSDCYMSLFLNGVKDPISFPMMGKDTVDKYIKVLIK